MSSSTFSPCCDIIQAKLLTGLAIIKMTNNVNSARQKFELMNEIKCLSV